MLRERKRRHDDIHFPLGGKGKRATPKLPHLSEPILQKCLDCGKFPAGSTHLCDGLLNRKEPNMTDGTPKTLIQAIQNATSEHPVPSPHDIDKRIEIHVIDFLAQKFGAAMLTEESLESLYERITGRTLKQ